MHHYAITGTPPMSPAPQVLEQIATLRELSRPAPVRKSFLARNTRRIEFALMSLTGLAAAWFIYELAVYLMHR